MPMAMMSRARVISTRLNPEEETSLTRSQSSLVLTEDTESNMDAIQEEIDKLVKGDDVIHFTSNSGNDPVDEDAVIQF